ncbi:MAG: class I SAM-dependent methyltransferase [Pseudomonadota bacterium]
MKDEASVGSAEALSGSTAPGGGHEQRPVHSPPELSRVYGSETVTEKRAHYERWARTYDFDLECGMGWAAPATVVGLLRKFLPDKSSKILDAGCGTGLVGAELSKSGYRQLTGIDFSAQMLRQAERRGIYSSLSEGDLTKPLDLSDRFDATLCVGLFGFGPPHVEHLHHLTATVPPGNPTIVTINSKGWDAMNWAEKLPREIEHRRLEMKLLQTIDYLPKVRIDARLLVITRQ